MALAYTAPTWQNGGGVGISASQLQALSDCMEGLVQGSDKAITDISISGQTITLTFADGSQETGTAIGLKGIGSIAKTGTSGNVDTYTITYTDGSTSTFTVTNGRDGAIQYTAGDGITISEQNVISAEGGKCLVLTKSTVSSLPITISNANITSDMVCIKAELSNLAAQGSDWTVTTSAGSLTISGTINSTTDIKLYLIKS